MRKQELQQDSTQDYDQVNDGFGVNPPKEKKEMAGNDIHMTHFGENNYASCMCFTPPCI